MKVVFSLLAGVGLAAGLVFSVTGSGRAEGLLDTDQPYQTNQSYGGCGTRCGAYLVPAPNPIPLRRLRVERVPAPVPAPCGATCANATNAWAAPPPCGQGGCGGTAFVYHPTRFYPYWKQPLYTACFPGPGNCYWRRECWYDSFGRRFCN
jgi:hypothetical protein